MLAEYTDAILQIFYSDISLHALQNVQGDDEQGFWCYLNSLYTDRSNTHFPFPEYIEKQFLWLKTGTFMQVSPAASEF